MGRLRHFLAATALAALPQNSLADNHDVEDKIVKHNSDVEIGESGSNEPPQYVFLLTDEPSFQRTFTTCTSDGHPVQASISLAADYRLVNLAFTSIGRDGFFDATRSAAASYQHSISTVINSLTAQDVRKSRQGDGRDIMRDNVTAVHAYFNQNAAGQATAQIIHYNFRITGVSNTPSTRICPLV